VLNARSKDQSAPLGTGSNLWMRGPHDNGAPRTFLG
jgi:hypothetical protein